MDWHSQGTQGWPLAIWSFVITCRRALHSAFGMVPSSPHFAWHSCREHLCSCLLRARLLCSGGQGASWCNRPGLAGPMPSSLPLATASCLPGACLSSCAPRLQGTGVAPQCSLPSCRSTSLPASPRLANPGHYVELSFFVFILDLRLNYLRWRYRCFYSAHICSCHLLKKKSSF